jgi:hypothetical protein
LRVLRFCGFCGNFTVPLLHFLPIRIISYLYIYTIK